MRVRRAYKEDVVEVSAVVPLKGVQQVVRLPRARHSHDEHVERSFETFSHFISVNQHESIPLSGMDCGL